MKNFLNKKNSIKVAGFFLILVFLFGLFRVVMLMPRSFEPQTTVKFSENTLQPWSSKVRYLRRLFGIYADSFVLRGGRNIQFNENYVEFDSRGLLTYLDLPLSRWIDAEKVNGVRIVMSFNPELQEDEKFLMNIGRYYSRMGVAFGDKFEHSLNVPLQSGDEWQEYSFYLAGFSDWHDKVNALRIIPSMGPGSVRIREISFLEEIPSEALKLQTATVGEDKRYLVYLSDLKDTPEGIIPLDNQLELSFLEPLLLPAEKINLLEFELDYTYQQPSPYLLFFDEQGKIVQFLPLKREDKTFVTNIDEQFVKFDYLGIYLPPDATDKLILDLDLEYKDNRRYSIDLSPLHNNALMGDRNNFAIFLTRQEIIPPFVSDSYMVVRYIKDKYFREQLKNISIGFHEVSRNNPRVKVKWQNAPGGRQGLIPFEYPFETVFLGKHPAFKTAVYHLSFILENFYGPLKVNKIQFLETSGESLTFDELAQMLYKNGLLFQNHGDCNSFGFMDGRYIVEARLEKGRIWSHQYPLIPDIMERLRIHYRLTGEPMTVQVHLFTGEVVETTAKIQTYNHPAHMSISLPDLPEPLTGFQFISPIPVNWGKIENISISGTDFDGEKHHAFLSSPERMMPSEDLSNLILDEIAEGEFLLLEDMKLVNNIQLEFDYTYSPNNRPYFYWYSQEKGMQTYSLDGILANGEQDEFVIPLSMIEEEILPVWGVSLFWCPGTLEILSFEVETND